MNEATAVLFSLAYVGVAVLIGFEAHAIWLICFATRRQFNRRLAKLRARHVDWREWRRE